MTTPGTPTRVLCYTLNTFSRSTLESEFLWVEGFHIRQVFYICGFTGFLLGSEIMHTPLQVFVNRLV